MVTDSAVFKDFFKNAGGLWGLAALEFDSARLELKGKNTLTLQTTPETIDDAGKLTNFQFFACFCESMITNHSKLFFFLKELVERYQNLCLYNQSFTDGC